MVVKLSGIEFTVNLLFVFTTESDSTTQSYLTLELIKTIMCPVH